ncbi:MAG: hypothetical protein ACOYLP_11040 [Flavobacterium sp.]|uniref:hypothetical protein n=1 Tax=Flavobacterium sp. TaxID=239 RepID=UPI003BC8DA64
MGKKAYKPNIIHEEEFFTGEKTSDVFMEVEFDYGTEKWIGALPKYLEKQGLDLTIEEFYESLESSFESLNPRNKAPWIADSDSRWSNKESATYKVLNALYSGKWECRVCGPVPKVNPQPSARLASLKKSGYVIGSKRRHCTDCEQKTMHDLLIMLPPIEQRFEHGNELRRPMSELLKTRIKKLLGYKEVCFDVKRSPVELIIDHKFPSQRWKFQESDNPNNMTEPAIRAKFQLLSNQTNLWKSRHCDNCVKTGKRGNFMGIKWFYQGNENWEGDDTYDEKGCVGCPWYDLEKWKKELKNQH